MATCAWLLKMPSCTAYHSCIQTCYMGERLCRKTPWLVVSDCIKCLYAQRLPHIACFKHSFRCHWMHRIQDCFLLGTPTQAPGQLCNAQMNCLNVPGCDTTRNLILYSPSAPGASRVEQWVSELIWTTLQKPLGCGVCFYRNTPSVDFAPMLANVDCEWETVAPCTSCVSLCNCYF